MFLAIWAACLAPFVACAQSLYVANQSTNTVTVFNAATGAPITSFAPTGLNHPLGLALSGNILYVSDNGVNGIYELNATTGALIRFIYDIGVSEPAFVAVSTVPEPTTGTLILLLGGGIVIRHAARKGRCS